MKAVIEHRVSMKASRIRSFIDREGDEPNAAILGRPVVADRRFSDGERNVALELAAVLDQHHDLRRSIQGTFAEMPDDMERTATDPRGRPFCFLRWKAYR